jgi:hypothetical protein
MAAQKTIVDRNGILTRREIIEVIREMITLE